MATTSTPLTGPVLRRVPIDPTRAFEKPSTRINDGDTLTFFESSLAYSDLLAWLLQLNRSMFPTQDPQGKIKECRLDSPPLYSDTVRNLGTLLSDLRQLVNQAPPDTGPRRFGNVAFRAWFRLAEDEAERLMQKRLGSVLGPWVDEGRSSSDEATVMSELKVYLLGSLGSAQRLDYGTGHELSFLAFLGCLWKLGAFEDGEEQSLVVGVFQPYLDLIRTLVLTYTLEPAGSHGVWGLDDHSFLPYIFGSAQYGPFINEIMPTPTEGSLPTAPMPAKVTDKPTVADYKDSNMYFSAIQFIYDVKRGPFWEHSPVLYDISGIKDGWGKINKGMLKMYAAEVLGKFPVVQHFPFGSFFRWEPDPEAQRAGRSVHAQEQPRSMDVPPAPLSASMSGAGTRAPWASVAVTTVPQMQATTGVPTSRAQPGASGAPR